MSCSVSDRSVRKRSPSVAAAFRSIMVVSGFFTILTKSEQFIKRKGNFTSISVLELPKNHYCTMSHTERYRPSDHRKLFYEQIPMNTDTGTYYLDDQRSFTP